MPGSRETTCKEVLLAWEHCNKVTLKSQSSDLRSSDVKTTDLELPTLSFKQQLAGKLNFHITTVFLLNSWKSRQDVKHILVFPLFIVISYYRWAKQGEFPYFQAARYLPSYMKFGYEDFSCLCPKRYDILESCGKTSFEPLYMVYANLIG